MSISGRNSPIDPGMGPSSRPLPIAEPVGKQGVFQSQSDMQVVKENFKAKIMGDLAKVESYIPSVDQRIDEADAGRVSHMKLGHAAIKAILGTLAAVVGFSVGAALLTFKVGLVIVIVGLFFKGERRQNITASGGRLFFSTMQPAMALFRSAYKDFQAGRGRGEVEVVKQEAKVAAKKLYDAGHERGLWSQPPASGTAVDAEMKEDDELSDDVISSGDEVDESAYEVSSDEDDDISPRSGGVRSDDKDFWRPEPPSDGKGNRLK